MVDKTGVHKHGLLDQLMEILALNNNGETRTNNGHNLYKVGGRIHKMRQQVNNGLHNSSSHNSRCLRYRHLFILQECNQQVYKHHQVWWLVGYTTAVTIRISTTAGISSGPTTITFRSSSTTVYRKSTMGFPVATPSISLRGNVHMPIIVKESPRSVVQLERRACEESRPLAREQRKASSSRKRLSGQSLVAAVAKNRETVVTQLRRTTSHKTR